MKLRRVVVAAICSKHNDEDSVRELGVKLLLRWGLVRASPEDLLLAAQL